MFYLALGVGAIALIALVAVYTLQSGKSNVQNIDLNEPVEVADDANTTEDTKAVIGDVNKSKDTAKDKDVAANTSDEENKIIEANPSTEDIGDQDGVVDTMNSPENESVELVFNQEAGLGWSLVGNVVLPFSMDTTIYFQTLEQYTDS